jgi:hypothetical protein
MTRPSPLPSTSTFDPDEGFEVAVLTMMPVETTRYPGLARMRYPKAASSPMRTKRLELFLAEAALVGANAVVILPLEDGAEEWVAIRTVGISR